ncbi:hypothetical protein Tco_0101402 [Tanacetum coccineum]
MKPSMEEDSDMASMPDDDVGLLFGSQTSENEDDENQSQHIELSKSEERDTDRVIDEPIELNAFANKPLDPLGYLQLEITSLSTKLDRVKHH